MRDLYSNLKAAPALAPAVHAASINGPAVNVRETSGVLFVLSTGAIAGAGAFGAKLQESADGATWADVPAKWLDAPGVPAVLAADASYRLGYRGKLAFVRLVLTKASGTSLAAGAVAVMRPHTRPVP